MLELKLTGPAALLPGTDSVYQMPEAWMPGLWLQTILYNHSDRVQRVGFARSSVCAAMAEHLRATLSGELEIFSPDARAGGSLESVYQPGADIKLAGLGDAVHEEITAQRIFFAPLADIAAGEAIAGALLQHLHTLGGKAVAWLTADNPPPVDGATAPNTVRFYRPVHMASVPDELRF